MCVAGLCPNPKTLMAAAGGAPRVVALAEELRRCSAAYGAGAGAVPPAWLCEHLLQPLAHALDAPKWPARCPPVKDHGLGSYLNHKTLKLD